LNANDLGIADGNEHATAAGCRGFIVGKSVVRSTWRRVQPRGLIPAGQTPDAMVVSPNGRVIHVTSNQMPGIVTPIDACTDQPRRATRVGRQPGGIVVRP
jgi:hypothetical protein